MFHISLGIGTGSRLKDIEDVKAQADASMSEDKKEWYRSRDLRRGD